MHIPYHKVWRPDIILYTNADSEYSKSVMSTDVIVTYDGNVTWSTAGIYKSSCHLDVRYYPFDQQNCKLKYASWAYDGTKIDIILTSNTGDQSNYMTSTEWILNSIEAEKNSIVYSCCPEPYPYVDIHINIERRPMFYVFNLILPCVLTSLVALLGFYMPSDSGEKVTLGITSLLSTTVFLMLVADSMPPTSDALPLIGLYYGVTIFIVSLATALTVFTLNIHHTGFHGDPVPEIVQMIAFKYVAKFLCMKIQTYHSLNDHVHYFYHKEHKITDESTSESSISTLKVANLSAQKYLTTNFGGSRTSEPFVTGILQKRETAKKRVSFSHESVVSTPNGACNQPRISPPPPTVICQPPPPENTDAFENDFFAILNKVHATIERNEMRLAEKDRRNAAELEWQQVALVLDRFLLVVFVIGTLITSLTILCQRQLNFLLN
uniref:Uncharacterized protein n=1 Tax=Panagrolaimus davidi TaxID=227884 RepID=A0A914QNY0_9BILA